MSLKVPSRYSSVFLKVLALVALFVVLPRSPFVSIAEAQVVDPCNAGTFKPIACENTRPGNAASEWDIVGAGDPTIQGFAADISVDQGQTVRFKILTDAGSYRLDIYRMGYYGGLGARKVATVNPTALLPQNQPSCLIDPATSLVDCGNWVESATWTVPATAASGIYFAKVIRTDTGGASHIVFVVRDDDGASDLLFQTSDTTWQAYNSWGGFSLYTGTPTRAYKVSYNRPFNTRELTPEDWVFNAEYPMVRWLEANGYNVSYTTGVDADRRGAEMLEHRVYLSVGHDEYWSGTQRANVEAARNAGKHLAFFSGNEIYWKTRWENSIDGSNTPYRTLVCYKETHANAKIDPLPNVWTGTWRDPRFSPPADGGRPENALSGTLSIAVADSGGQIEIPEQAGKLRFWRNTSMATLLPGTRALLPVGILGYEWDTDADNGFRPAGLLRLSDTTLDNVPALQDYGNVYSAATANHALTFYRHSSGAFVFSAGTVQWAWGLDSSHDRGISTTDLSVQQATVNVLADMGTQPFALLPDLVPAVASADAAKPTATIVSPVAGSDVSVQSLVIITGTAVDAGGGRVAVVEVSVDGGATWKPATGTTAWTFAWQPETLGPATISARAVDDSGNIQSPPATRNVTVQIRACPCSIWNAGAVPGGIDGNDPNGIEVGVKFRPAVNGFITGLRFYKSAANTGLHLGNLWTTSGDLLARIAFTSETASGWQEATFATPIAVSANTTYIASYHAPAGHYSFDGGALGGAGIDNWPLLALQSGVEGGNGVFLYTLTSQFPSTESFGHNYWMDVVFNMTVGSGAPPPVVLATSPLNGDTSVDPRAIVSVILSQSMNPATINGTTFTLRDSTGAAIPATVAYDAASRMATLQTVAPMAFSGVYTATVTGGTGGMADATGKLLGGNTIWSFTIVGPPSPPRGCPCSIWSPADVPAVVDSNDLGPVELGVRFQPESDGLVSAIRFYKAPTNNGTHVANLWSGAGTLLGTATFSGETASGWQEVTLPTPVAVTGGASYVASYYTITGHESYTANYFVPADYDNPPLRALRGLFRYGASGFPTGNGNGANYWVDVVYSRSLISDGTPPAVQSVTPGPGVSGVAKDTALAINFSKALNPSSISASTVQLRDPQGFLVPLAMTYDARMQRVTIQVTTVLAYGSIYTGTVKGGPNGIKDTSGNTLASDYVWSFTTASGPAIPFTSGADGPILIVTDPSRPFSTYLSEILRNEGLNYFALANLSTVSAATLAAYDVVVLGEMPLSGAQVTMFTNWVNAGGNLIAMRPDKQLAALLGITDAGSTLSDAYMLVNNATQAGAGIVGQTMQYHGTADKYTLGTATAIATLYSSAGTSTPNPAVTLRSVGANGGQAAAFTYDVAKSVVYTRQGNPAWSGQERDGLLPIRADDLFFGGGSPDWVDFNKISIPQADEQQRLLINLILTMNVDKKPLPRFWYFPKGKKAVVVMTGDDHNYGGTAGRFETYRNASPVGCVLENWECVRSTSYVYLGAIDKLAAGDYVKQGFEVALHLNTGGQDFTPAGLQSMYDGQLGDFLTAYPSLPRPATHRTHAVVWSDYASQPQAELDHDIRFDTTYYYYPGSWVQNRPGLFTGSGMPMRFATAQGATIDVYQATTQMTDESGQTYPLTVDALLDKAVGAEGYYGAFTANMHTDLVGSAGSDAIIASAQARGVPIVSSKQMLDWLDGRNGSYFDAVAWSGNTLTFTVSVAEGANGLQAMVPASSVAGALVSITKDGGPVVYITQTIKGVTYASFEAPGGSYAAVYGGAPNAPSGLTATTASSSQINLSWTDASSNETAFKIERKTGAGGTYAEIASVGPNVTAYNNSGLAASTTYFYRVRATNALGASGYSNEASATTNAAGGVGTGTGLLGDYFNNSDLTSPTLSRIDSTVNFDWGTGTPNGSTGADTFSVRWTGLVEPRFTQTYRFYTSSDDGVRLWVNGVQIVNNWTDHGVTENSGTIALNANQRYPIVMEYYENTGGAVARLSWSSPSVAKQIIPATALYADVPKAPANLTATPASTTQINLAWSDASNNEAGFRIERSTDNVNFAEITVVGRNVTSYNNTGLATGTQYFYRVRAYSIVGTSIYSNTASATTLSLPAAPSGLTASAASATQINLSWTDNATNETSYLIERKTGAGGTYAQIASVGANVTSYNNTGLSTATTYFYRVRATNAQGNSVYSNEASATTGNAPPAAPSGLIANAASSSQINLSWTDNSSNEVSFKIERKTGAGGTYAEIATVGANVTNYSNTGLTPSTTYYYRARSSNAAGDSAYSAETSATTLATIPAAPSGLTATAVSGTQINLAWTDNSSNETSFKIERKTGSGGTYAEIATVGSNVTTYNNTGLSPATTYYYRVRAANSGGNSAYSAEANATTSSAPSFRAAASARAVSGVLTLTIGKPAGTAQGDVMVASIAVRPSSATINAPGWTLVRRLNNANSNANSLAVYYKVAGAAEPASYSWTFNTSTGAVGGIQSFIGIDTANPVDVEAGQNTANGLAHAAPSVTTRFANSMIVTSHAFASSATFSAPAGMTERVDIASDAVPLSSGEAMQANTQLQAAIGATGTRTATASNDADVGNAHTLALKAK